MCFGTTHLERCKSWALGKVLFLKCRLGMFIEYVLCWCSRFGFYFICILCTWILFWDNSSWIVLFLMFIVSFLDFEFVLYIPYDSWGWFFSFPPFLAVGWNITFFFGPFHFEEVASKTWYHTVPPYSLSIGDNTWWKANL